MYVKYTNKTPFMCNKSTVYGGFHNMYSMYNTLHYAHWAGTYLYLYIRIYLYLFIYLNILTFI